ncbi:MAG: bifunctional rhamnulose-1-phosphate aldolase/short-chain dehydrogenase, partial [Pseudomonadota bacterium]
RLRDYDRDNPGLQGIVLEGHGLFTWAETSEDCYALTVEVIAKAARALNARFGSKAAFGGPRMETKAKNARRDLAARIMMNIRPLISQKRPKVGHFVDTPEVLEFVGSSDMERLARMGTSCPDHFLRTKILPLIVDAQAWEHDGTDALDAAFDQYRKDYAAYYDRNAQPDSPPIRDANPVIYLIPGIGLASFAGDKTTARIASEFYQNAINVMRGAEALNGYQGLDEREAFDIEYWQLEEDKLSRRPAPKPFDGRIAVITGGAGGIGLATARRLLSEGACVMLADIDAGRLSDVEDGLSDAFGRDRIAASVCDVTDEDAVTSLIEATGLAFGGVDIAVANAGLASAAPVEDTTLDLFRKNHSVLVDGYFLLARECFKRMKRIGGSIVFVGSKNALVASKNASAYASAKAAELHLARCLALEGAEHGIRVNSVNPDAVLKGSNIWTGKWREERADAYGLGTDDLEDHYRKRSLLGRSVYPEDIAEAVAYFAGDLSSKSTGNILNVDAGHAGAFTR